jgi:hypothetical protein
LRRYYTSDGGGLNKIETITSLRSNTVNEIVIRILNNSVRLDEKCWSCSDRPTSGIHTTAPSVAKEDGTCDICEGVGYKPTDEGMAILALIKRHSGDSNNVS